MIQNQKTKNDNDIINSLKVQAKIRAAIGFPVMTLMSIFVWHGAQRTSDWVALGIVLSLHSFYIAIARYLPNHPKSFAITKLVIATAVLDPLMLSAWLAILNEMGSFVICFYLFSILGYGFRMGQRPMFICQIASLVGFGTVLLVSSSWQQNLWFGASFLSLLMVVPFYAKILIRKLHDARALAETESLAKSELLAKVSHDLRTPIAGIMASAELLLTQPRHGPVAQVEKRANTILSLSKQLLAEINDLLDTAKYQANALVLERAAFDLRDVMEQLRLTLASAAAAKQIELNINVDDAIHDFIQSDAHYLNKVLTNIAGNAVKFTARGSVDVGCTLLEDGDDFYRIRFSVRDTGIGIPGEMHEKIFEPFVQASSGTTRQYGGTGLGMSIAKELVALMGGKIILESETGKGSLFFFDLTFSKVAKEKLINSNPPEEVLVVYRKRILVADDNETNLILIKELLETDDHHVTTSGSGQQTLEILSTEEFDVIFLDYNMGDIEGSKVLELYRIKNPTSPPTFFLTADTTLATSEKLINVGATGVLHKPISRDRLRHTLATLFASEAVIAQSRAVSRHDVPDPSVYFYNDMIEELRSISPRPEFLEDLLANAMDDIEANCVNLISAIEADDLDKVPYKAHALASACSAVGAMRLDFLARKIMAMTLSELKSKRVHYIGDVKEALAPTIKAIKTYQKEATH